MRRAFRLDGRIAIVTGGAGNIGSSLSRGLAEMGATVVIAARDAARCTALAEAMGAEGLSAIGLPLDLGEADSIAALHQAVVDRFGRVDILVSNAISQVPGHVERYPLADWEASMRVDATGWFALTQLCLNTMLAQGGGNIITIASILGMVAPDERLYPERGIAGFRPTYFFVKAGVVGFTRFLAAAYADKGIRVNCISPGGVQTKPPRTAGSGFAERTPMRRLADADEMKGAVVYLASDASSYVTGHNLVVDGGYTAW